MLTIQTGQLKSTQVSVSVPCQTSQIWKGDHSHLSPCEMVQQCWDTSRKQEPGGALPSTTNSAQLSRAAETTAGLLKHVNIR